LLVNYWAKQIRDRIKIAWETNLVLANREARLTAPSGEDLSGGNAWDALRASTEKIGVVVKSQILVYLYRTARNYFLKNS